MLQKVITFINNKLQLVDPVVASTGVADAGRVVAVDSNGYINPSTLPPGVGVQVDVFPAGEAIPAGKFVNKYDDAGTIKVRLADNSNGRRADGFVQTAVALGANASVYRTGAANTAVSGLTGGTLYYLGAAGGVVDTIAPGAGVTMIQQVGIADGATQLAVNLQDPWYC